MRWKIIFMFLVIGVILISFAYFSYNKPHPNIAESKPDYQIRAIQLAAEYNQEEESANRKYLGKVLEVEGKVIAQGISNSNPVEAILELEGNNQSTIRCSLLRTGLTNEMVYEVGSTVRIKGICIGLLQDVNLRDCIVINETGI